MRRIIFSFLFLLMFFSFFFINSVQAQEVTCEKSEVTVIFRDSEGVFIPNINFAIYVQIKDVDGLPKPGQQVASGKTSAITGRSTVTFTNEHSIFVIKAWDKNSNEGAFYFYDILEICGGEITVENSLSAINFSFRDTRGNLVKNQAFSVYTQRYDADDKPIKEKQDLVISQNTSEEGEVKIYVPESSKSIDGNGTDYYVMEAKAKDGGFYQKFDTLVTEGETSEIEYVFSDVVFTVKDSQGISFPAGEKISVYKQIHDTDDNFVLGDFVKNIYTDDQGIAVFQYPAGVYAVRLVGENDQNLDFFDMEILENERTEYDLTSNEDWSPSVGACDLQSSLTINTKTLSGEVLSGVKYELYEQELDINGIPKATNKKMNGQVDTLGKAVGLFNPDPRKKYALKLYLHNSKVGEFWYFDELQFVCGQNIEITIELPALRVILRNGDNSLVKNKTFSLYTQKFDVDGSPIREKKDLVSSTFTTSEEGVANIYVASDHLFDKEKKGTYILEVMGENSKKYIEYDIKMLADQDTNLDYIFSDVIVELKQANGQALVNKKLTMYSRSFDIEGGYILGVQQGTAKTDVNGKAIFPLPAGFYALKLEDDIRDEIIFWNVRVSNRKRRLQPFTVNNTRVSVYDANSNVGLTNQGFSIYKLKQNNEGSYERDKKIKDLKTGNMGYKDLILASNPYLFVVKKDKKEHGTVIYSDNKKVQQIKINLTNNNLVDTTQKYNLQKPASAVPMYKKLAGRILLQVEGLGEAWYVDASSRKRYYMENGPVAYEMMRKFGLGISNKDLRKIPIGLDDRFEEFDYDGDMVSDKMEEAIGTDMYNNDSDEDGFDDGEEIKNGFDPLGKGRLELDLGLANKLKGRIVLQVESRGEAWYVNPEDGKRYYMKDGESAYEIMRFLSLGITNDDLEEIETGSLTQ